MNQEHSRIAAAGDEFTSEQWTKVDAVIRHYRDKLGALIPVLEEIQGITGHLPESVQRRVAQGLDLPLSQVYGVVTFYSYFTMRPRGKHQIRVCLGTSCHVRGGSQIEKRIEEDLSILPGEITPDRQFSLDIVRCVGACGLAPVVVVDEDTHKQVKSAKLGTILDQYRSPSAAQEG